MCRHHVLPADSFHHVGSVTAVRERRERRTKIKNQENISRMMRHLRVDEIDRLRFKLIGGVKVCEYQRLCRCFY